MSQREGYGVVSQAWGKEIKIKEVDEERYLEKFGYIPRPILDTLVQGMRENNSGRHGYGRNYDKGVENLRRYMEREPTKLEEWVTENKAAFS
jgi:hypothetical protein